MAVVGCQEPSQIVPVGPPGIEFQRIPVNPDAEPAATYPVVVANILASALDALAPLLADRVAPTQGGAWSADRRFRAVERSR